MAKYNINLNKGIFKKDQLYKYRCNQNKIYVSTAEGNEQDFFLPDFQALFFIEK